MTEGKITFNRDDKFDIQLSAAMVAERRLGEIFASGKFERIELKTEKWQWRRTGNIAIEYRRAGRPSGISTTQADYWFHELLNDDGRTMGYLVFPVPYLKELCRAAIKARRFVKGGGDGGLSDIVLLRVRDLLALF